MRVLLVADKNAPNKALKRQLEEVGFQTELASEPRDVARKASDRGWRVIVLDLLWSRGNALDWLEKYRQAGNTTHLLALAGTSATAQIVRALDLGADDVLGRPLEAEEFLARVRALMRRSLPNAAPSQIIHDLMIDRQAHCVRRGGQTIHLTPREFAVLEILARQPGQVVNRPTIYQHLYDSTERMPSNVVDVYIRYLRNKIDRGFEVPLILTRWGQGYMLRAESNGHKH